MYLFDNLGQTIPCFVLSAALLRYLNTAIQVIQVISVAKRRRREHRLAAASHVSRFTFQVSSLEDFKSYKFQRSLNDIPTRTDLLLHG